ncbi:hypothetical protein AVEN_63745-1 [Araneus ventricosus]|uniref:Uncharacterized protein n=1 Tax=Araneus ventricosus TaxID=182803 RepID=A0A4Y2V7R4_ARAVE|nr:hypothetical protein AVEN_63745-1 [Araneus ventricosus]
MRRFCLVSQGVGINYFHYECISFHRIAAKSVQFEPISHQLGDRGRSLTRKGGECLWKRVDLSKKKSMEDNKCNAINFGSDTREKDNFCKLLLIGICLVLSIPLITRKTAKRHNFSSSKQIRVVQRNCPKPIETPVKFAKSEGDDPANYSGCTEKPLQVKKSAEVELTTTAWNDEVKGPTPAKRETPGFVPRSILLKHPPLLIENAGQVEFQSDSSQPPTRTEPFNYSSIAASLWQMTSMISNLSRMMSSFMNQIMAMLLTLKSSLKIQAQGAPPN